MHRSGSFARGLAAMWLSLALGFACFTAAAAEPAPQDREAFHKAMGECAAEQGLTPPEPGQRPDDSKRPDREKMDKCLDARGFKAPPHRGKRPPPPEEDEEW